MAKRLGPKNRERYLKKCRGRLDAAKGFRKTERLEELWQRMEDLYRGRHFPKDLAYDDAIAINHAFSIINVIVPSVAINYPKTVVRAKDPQDYDRATILEAVVNYWWRQYDILPEFQQAVKDSLIFGFGWLKVGYRFVEEEVNDEEAFEQEYQSRRQEIDAYAQANPDLAGDLPTDEELRASIPQTKKSIVKTDQPFVERCAPKDIFVDPESTSPRDMKWIAQRLTKTLSEVRNNKAYKESVRKSVEPDAHLDNNWFSGNTNPDEKDGERVTVWEYYDLQNGQMCVFAETGDDLLVDPVPQPYVFGHPFIYVPDHIVPNQFYAMGELEALEPLQMELNMTRTQMFNDRKQWRRKWLYDPKAFDDTGRQALQSDQDNVFVPVNANVPLPEAVIPMPSQTVNAELYQQSEIIENDLTNISGVNEYQRGGVAEIRRTATEAAIMQDSANARAADKLAKVEKVVTLISRRLVQLAQQYMESGQIARITGKSGASAWFYYEPSDIQGEYDFEVEGGSTQPYNEAQRRKTAIDMLQALAPFGAPDAGLINMREVIAFALEYGFEVKDPARFLMDLQPPGVAAAAGMPGQAIPEGPPEPPALPVGEELGMVDASQEDASQEPIQPPQGGSVPPELVQALAG